MGYVSNRTHIVRHAPGHRVETALMGGGEMGARMRAFDWASTDLGAAGSWPQSLKTAVSICLNSRFPTMLWWGRDLTVLYNDPYLPILGVKHPSALGRPGEEAWREMWPIVGPTLRHVLERGETTLSEDLPLYLERNGEPKECYFSFSYSPIRDESGGVGGVFTLAWETTTKVIHERPALPAGSLKEIPGPHGRILLADDNADLQTGVADLLAPAYDVVTVADGAAAIAAVEAAARAGEPFDLVLADIMMPGVDGFGVLQALRANPLTRSVSVILLSGRAGEERRIEGLEAGADDYLVKPFGGRELLARIGAHVALTRMGNAMSALRESQERFRKAFDGAATGFALVELNGRFRAANRSLSDMLGYTEFELQRLSFRDITYSEDLESDLALVDRLLAGEIEGYRLEKRFVHKNGHLVWVLVAVSLVRDEAGAPQYFVSQGTDITPQKEAEEALARRAEELERSNAELEQFAYVASHDLQQPLRTVASYAELLAERYLGQLDERADRWITYVMAGVDRMQRLIDDLLALARVHTHGGAFVEADTGALVPSSWESVRHEYPLEATLTYSQLPIVTADVGQLEQLFQNLFDNALKYSRPDVPLEVRVSAVPAGKEPTVWEFTVQDNGIGLDMVYADRIFEIFQRLHCSDEYVGTGIGLASAGRSSSATVAESKWIRLRARVRAFTSPSSVKPWNEGKRCVLADSAGRDPVRGGQPRRRRAVAGRARRATGLQRSRCRGRSQRAELPPPDGFLHRRDITRSDSA
jgi:PAS domain S-box-containing protein